MHLSVDDCQYAVASDFADGTSLGAGSGAVYREDLLQPYLWQMLFLTHSAALPSARWRPLELVQTTGLRYVAVLGFGLASYYLLEKPMMRLGHRLAKPATPGRDGLEDSNQPRFEVREAVSGTVLA